MSDTSQVRINELARELEVKAKAIIDLLAGYGVTEKKTHSSSIPADVAEKVRHHLKGVADAETAAEAAAQAERDARDAAAKAARRAAPVPAPAPAPIPATPAPAPVAAAPAVAPAAPPAAAPNPAAPAPAVAAPAVAPAPAAAPPAARPVAPAAAPASAAPAPAAPTSAPAARPAAPAPASTPAAAPAAPARPAAPTTSAPGTPTTAPAQRPAPTQPLRPGAPGGQQPGARPGAPGQPGARPPQRQTQPGQPGAARPAAAAPGAPRPQTPVRPMPTGGNRGPVPGTVPGSGGGQQRPSGPRPGQPMRPQHSGGQGGRPFTQRSGSGGPGGPGGSGAPNRPAFGQRPGAAVPSGTRPGPRMPGRPGMLPPLPDKMPPKAEPGKPLYTRKPQQRQRPMADKREMEGERKLHPTRQRQGAGGRGVAVAVAPPEPRAPREVTLTEGITIRELAEKLDIRAKDLLKNLLDRGVFASINQALDVQTATDLAQSFNGVVSVVSFEEEMVLEVAKEETRENLKPRPPVVTVMGHVDHGKTSLLDAIRAADVAGGEAGGITQHIGAYKVQVNDDRSVVFVDTPGHEAFTRMRARGAKVTDIVVLVVAADDGVMPQTREAVDHAKAANVPIIVAINKIDKPEAQPERVKRQLTEAGLMPAEWGGDTEFVEVSAKQKKGLDKLLETILLVADLRELRANPDAPASGTVLESRVDKGRGPVATILVQNGTLKAGDFFICGAVFGKVRAMFDDRGRTTKDAPPSTPVEVLG